MKRISHSAYALLAIITLALLPSCATLGLPTPETFNQKVAVAYGTVTQVRESALMLLTTRQITPDEAQNVNKAADVAREGIDTARKLHDTQNVQAADAKLLAVRGSLQALAAYLTARGSRP